MRYIRCDVDDHPVDVALPAIFRKTPEGPTLWNDADTLRHCASLDELKSLLVSRL